MNHNLFKRIVRKCGRIRDYVRNNFLYFCMDYSSDEKIRYSCRKILLRWLLRGRKLVGFYGECHIYVYAELLRKSREFKRKYVAVGDKEIEYLIRYHKQINKPSVWNKLDVLVFNSGVPIRQGGPGLSEVLEWLPKEALRIGVTNATFLGYMPQHTSRVFPNQGYFIWGDKNLNRILEAEENIDENLRILGGEEYYSVAQVQEHFSKAIKKLSTYEKNCIIKIADYIEENGRNRILYYSVTHPETEIMIELARRIAEKLDVHDIGNTDSFETELFNLHSHGEVVYPSVCKGLGISDALASNRKIQPGNYPVEYTFEEYIREYVNRAGMKEERNHD